MSPDRCWKPADSDPTYTLDSEEPVTVMVNAVAEVPLEGEMVVLARPPLVWPDVGYI